MYPQPQLVDFILKSTLQQISVHNIYETISRVPPVAITNTIILYPPYLSILLRLTISTFNRIFSTVNFVFSVIRNSFLIFPISLQISLSYFFFLISDSLYLCSVFYFLHSTCPCFPSSLSISPPSPFILRYLFTLKKKDISFFSISPSVLFLLFFFLPLSFYTFCSKFVSFYGYFITFLDYISYSFPFMKSIFHLLSSSLFIFNFSFK
ncbi:unnamed protein product [Acanthosepion pharaonis]|uniref:Uncharacterized protein n=1 Tax=Acanthosepion pharaonis TaxID=158019 RepID=A0A812APX2_ACAPH|nr:unnamed protein product [Sepia pharaonis]